jgi:tetratricopeptide (TPR) repeat protein
MFILAYFVLLGWIPFTLFIFAILPPQRAVITAFILGWLFMPLASFGLSGLPDYEKRSAICISVLLATLLFHSDVLLRLRPRWVDLPMAVFCACPIASSLNNGMGLYDGLSMTSSNLVMWGLPYIIGRAYFTRLEHLRELAIGFAVGGLIYAPFCLWETRMSPQLHLNVYGFTTGWGEIKYGGYCPKVFMNNGLELAMWMITTVVVGFWLWASGSLKRLRDLPFDRLLLGLLVVAVLCRGTGATFLLTVGIALWFALKWTKLRLPALVLLTFGPLYFITRSTGLWSGRETSDLVRMVVNQTRADSLLFRLMNEDMLAAKALQRPLFGWGGWGRNRVFDEEGRDLTITDGYWIIVLGNFGVVGLTSWTASLLLPMGIMVKRYPAPSWRDPSLAVPAVLSIILNIHLIDCTANAFPNSVYILSLGAVTEVLALLRPPARRAPAPTVTLAVNNPLRSSAIRHDWLARSLKQQGQTLEAEAAWLSAQRAWSRLAAESPDVPEYRQHWLDSYNDLAWLLLTTSDWGQHNVSRAILLAEKAVERAPECGTYWNTLGIAYFRAGDWKAAIAALERSIASDGGGTSFDFFFLGMAYWHQGDEAQAHLWCARADDWMEKNRPGHADLLRFRAEATSLLAGHAPRG